MSVWYIVFSLIPRNLVSRLTGLVVQWRLPWPLSGCAKRLFVGVFGIDMSEAETSLSDYATIEDVFTRRLRPEARQIASGGFVSPADGMIVRSATAVDGQAIQVKGRDYSLAELLGLPHEQVPLTDSAHYTTIYLAPHNYHRVHAPFSGRLHSVSHITGTLWPVNARFVRLVPNLFVQNERLVFEFDLNGAPAWVVMVGALNVGRMRTPFVPDFYTNSGRARTYGEKNLLKDGPVSVKLGEELGTFMLGSTVVIVLSRPVANELKPKLVDTTHAIQLGAALS